MKHNLPSGRTSSRKARDQREWQRECVWPDRQSRTSAQRGSVLLLVVVVIAMLTLAAFNFTKLMTTEYEAATTYAKDIQSRESADSGIEFVATLLGNRKSVAAENLIHNPQLFMGHVVSPSTHLRANGRFSIIEPVEHDPKSSAIRYGLVDESAKINLNYLPNSGWTNAQIQAMLIKIPNMTPDIIDSLLDWMDSDDTISPHGAESETYQALTPPYKAKNGPFELIDELLLVKGITPTLLYGEDANRNGLLDPNENDGEASSPIDNADGVLDHGFAAYLSVYGRESNRQSDGTLKINVNNGYLTDLHDELAKAFNSTTADFIIGYRINGPYYAPPAKPTVSATNPVPPADPNAPPPDPNAPSVQSTVDKEAADGLAKFAASVLSGTAGETTRNGIDLKAGGPTNIESIWQLVGAQVQVRKEGTLTVLDSPWPDEASSLKTTMGDVLEKLTVTTDEYLEGRVNINQARREVLMALVGNAVKTTMTEQIVDGIIAAQRLDSSGQPQLDVIKQHNTTAWLYAENLVDLPGMVNLDPYITAHGDIYRAQVLGFFDGGGPVARVEATIDSTQRPPRVILLRDLNELGRGYSRNHLLTPPVSR